MSIPSNVLAFACLTESASGRARCDRQRWYAGDHRGLTETGGLLEWSDPPAPPPQEDPVTFGDRPEHQSAPALRPTYGHVHDPSCAFGNPQCDLAGPHTPELDEQAETWSQTPEVTGGGWALLDRLLAVVALVVLCAVAPAVIIGVWRLALGLY